MDEERHTETETRRRELPELPLYYILVALYFFAFGMQFVLFPSLVAFFLGATAAGVASSENATSEGNSTNCIPNAKK